MVLRIIQAKAEAYAQYLAKQKHHPFDYLWEAQLNFQTKWDMTAPDFAKMYDGSLENSKTQRLWRNRHWEPKRVMQVLIKHNAATAKHMFEDLFNETKEIENRVGRFLFFCDELLTDFKFDNKTSIENNHYHDDFRMISLYLAFRYPENYAVYHHGDFTESMRVFQAKSIPDVADPMRFFKVANTLYMFLEKNGKVIPNLQNILSEKSHFKGKSLLLVTDFLRFCAQN